MLRRWTWGLGLGLALWLWPVAPGAWAQGVIYKKYTVVDFGDDTVEGDLSRPDGAYLESRKRLRHQRLIRIRQNFRSEVLQSIQYL